MNKVIPIIFLLSVNLICSCTRLRLHTAKYPLIDNKSIGFGTDKDSIPGLIKINYEDIDDENRSHYYLKNQILFDSLRLAFYKDKLYRCDGFFVSRKKADELYTFLCNNFEGKKSDKTRYFEGGRKNCYIHLTQTFSDSSFTFTFFERNICDAFIFHCATPRRIHFWKGPNFWRFDMSHQERKRKKIEEMLHMTSECRYGK